VKPDGHAPLDAGGSDLCYMIIGYIKKYEFLHILFVYI
jgi:hypothetical protein